MASIKTELTVLELIREGLDEFFRKNPNPKGRYKKIAIMEFLHKTFIFCDFDPQQWREDMWNRYLWIIMDYYATERNMTLIYKVNHFILLQKS